MVTVCGNASYAVALDSGRHLHPGEVTEVTDSPRLRQFERDGLVTIVKPPRRSSSVEKPNPSEKE